MTSALAARVRPAPRPPPPPGGRRGVARRRVARALFAAGAAVAAALWLRGAPNAPTGPPAAPTLAWTPADADAGSFGVDALAGERLRVEAVERHGSGARREWLRLTGPAQTDGREPDTRIVVTIGSDPASASTGRGTPTAFLAAARLAARAGRGVAAAGEPSLAPTRFGPAETTEIELLPAGDAPTRCNFLRLPPTPDGLELQALRCGEAASAAPLPCVVDRLDMSDAGADPRFRAALATARPLGPPTCPGAPKLDAPAPAPATMPAPRLATRPAAAPSPPAPPRAARSRDRDRGRS